MTVYLSELWFERYVPCADFELSKIEVDYQNKQSGLMIILMQIDNCSVSANVPVSFKLKCLTIEQTETNQSSFV